MRPLILSALATLAADCGFRVLLAVESGSRAWGFESADSDWDVRFFYAWPRDAYLRVQPPAATFSRMLPDDLDLSGWDLRMALAHFGKSSASVHEWLGSPLFYMEDDAFCGALRGLQPSYFRARSVIHHYLGLARSLRAQAGEGEALNGKKCLYVLRALLAAQWTLTRSEPPPVPFATLAGQITDPALRGEIDALVSAKRAGSEADAFPVSAALREFMDEQRADLEEAVGQLESAPVDPAPLDALFRATLAAEDSA